MKQTRREENGGGRGMKGNWQLDMVRDGESGIQETSYRATGGGVPWPNTLNNKVK